MPDPVAEAGVRRFTVGSREVDLDRAEVRGPQGSVPLTPNEVKVLGVLARQPGRVVERDVLLCDALRYRAAINTRAIDQAVWRLRRKLEPEPHAPRWLLSEANVGYRLELDPPPPKALVGRGEELARLLELLDEGRPVAVVGLPGSGRRALVAAAGGSDAVRILGVIPEDRDLAVVRIGPLAPDAARALLIREVLALRGAGQLSEEEDGEAAAAAARAGHHPATLRQMAEASALHRLGKVPVDVLPEVAAHVAALPEDVRDVLVQCAPWPDPFLPEEVGLPASALMRAWRACVLDSVEGGDGQRRLVVPPCVRAAAPPDPAHPASRAFAARAVAAAVPPALELLRSFDRDAREAVLAQRARVDAALALGAPEQRRALIPAVLARWAATDALPDPLPAHDDALTPDQAVCVDLLHAFAAERGQRGAGATFVSRALGRTGTTPLFAGYALRTAYSRAVWGGAGAEEVQALIDAMGQLADAHPDPALRAAFHHARGVRRIRLGHAGARDDLVASMTLFGPRSTARGTLASILAAEAVRDGRVGEALAWLDTVDPSLSPPNEEARKRLQRVHVLHAAGRLDEAARELDLAELLGSRAWTLGLGRATQALLEGRADHAVVLAEAVQAEVPQLGEAAIGLPMVLGWARVAQGLGDRALAIAEGCPPAMLTHEGYDAQLGLLRAAALARSTRADGVGQAEVVLDGLVAPQGRWWPLARGAVTALVRGDAAAAAAIARETERTGISHLITRFALVAA